MIFGGPRQRSYTALRLEKMKKEEKIAARIKRISWKHNPLAPICGKHHHHRTYTFYKQYIHIKGLTLEWYREDFRCVFATRRGTRGILWIIQLNACQIRPTNMMSC